ncbi:MAG: metal ABC transporter substrate-binding protein [Alphaproteobacteria bacterium]|nr:metal ABC transporter substrate-binding protein [Alphaproteobacteria bacterium]
MSVLRSKILLLAALMGLAQVALPAAGQVKVVASFTLLADMAREIGGPDVEVRSLVGPDADAHVFQPTPADAKAVAEANLVLVNGLGFEGWMNRLIRASGSKAKVVVVSTGIAPLRMDKDEHEKHVSKAGRKKAASTKVDDPHAWQDVANARHYAANIAAAFAAADPAKAVAHGERAARYDAALAELDAWIKGAVARVPEGRRKIVTAHDAFQYFAGAYGVEFIGVHGVSTESEVSAKTVASIVEALRKSGVKALFIENISDPRLMERIAQETGATIGGKLHSDALSPPGGGAETYIAMMRKNVEALVAAMERN